MRHQKTRISATDTKETRKANTDYSRSKEGRSGQAGAKEICIRQEILDPTADAIWLKDLGLWAEVQNYPPTHTEDPR